MQRRTILSLSAVATLLTGTVATAQIGQGRLRTEDGVTVQVVGRVRSADQNSFTLVANGMTFEVRANRREVIGNQDLRNGFRVRVYGDLTQANRIDADQVMVVSRDRDDGPGGNRPGGRARTLSGTVRSVSQTENFMTLNAAAGNLRVEWDRDTEFTRNGQRSTPRDFRVGDTVRVVGTRTGLSAVKARRVIVGGQAGWVNGGVGEILSLDKRANEMEVDFDGDVWTVKLVNARITQGGRRVEIDDLRLDQDVRVSGTARGNKTVEATEVAFVGRGSGR